MMFGKTQVIVKQAKNENTSVLGARFTKAGTLFHSAVVLTQGHSQHVYGGNGLTKHWEHADRIEACLLKKKIKGDT